MFFGLYRVCCEHAQVCINIAPWNAPAMLSFGPMISMMAAGNHVGATGLPVSVTSGWHAAWHLQVVIKPPDLVPNVSAAVRKKCHVLSIRRSMPWGFIVVQGQQLPGCNSVASWMPGDGPSFRLEVSQRLCMGGGRWQRGMPANACSHPQVAVRNEQLVTGSKPCCFRPLCQVVERLIDEGADHLASALGTSPCQKAGAVDAEAFTGGSEIAKAVAARCGKARERTAWHWFQQSLSNPKRSFESMIAAACSRTSKMRNPVCTRPCRSTE